MKKLEYSIFFFFLIWFMFIEIAKPSNEDLISFNYSFPSPQFEKDGKYDLIKISGLNLMEIPGLPMLPYKTAKILIPYGKKVKRLEIRPSKKIEIDGFFKIKPAPNPLPLCDCPKDFNPNPINFSVYNSSENFPGFKKDFTIQKKRGHEILIIYLYPIQYNPVERKLIFYKEIRLDLYLENKNPVELQKQKFMFRGLSKDIELVNNFVNNPSTIQFSLETLVNASENYTYLIITNKSFNQSFTRLMNFRKTQGISSKIVFVEDILADPDYDANGTWGDCRYTENCNLTLFNDTQAHIRNFIKNAYYNWSTEYVLLGGDTEIIPAREVYANEYLPCDLYYGQLDDSWNYDQDEKFGELNDGYNGSNIDLATEVYVGRAPVDTVEEAENFVNKTIAYETDKSNYISEALYLGLADYDFSWYGGDFSDDVERAMPQFTSFKFYERDGTFNKSKVIEKLNNGFNLLIHTGHGGVFGWYNSNGNLALNASDIKSLTNDKYFWVFTLSCYTSAFDDYGGTDGEAFGEHFISSKGGAFAYIGYTSATTVTEGYRRKFFKLLTNSTLLGEVFEDSRYERFIEAGYYTFNLDKFYEQFLFGDPLCNLTINLTRPTAYIKEPSVYKESWPGLYLKLHNISKLFNIFGTAKKGNDINSNFSNWTLYYTIGKQIGNTSLSGWHKLAQNNSEKDNQTLSLLDTTILKDGIYTLRLDVNNGSNYYGYSWIIINVLNNYITYPKENQEIFGDLVIQINGTANGTYFQNYTVDYASYENLTNFKEINFSTTPVDNGALASWNVTNLSSGTYMIRLVVRHANFTNVNNVTIKLYKTHINYPKNNSIFSEGVVKINGTSTGLNYSVEYASFEDLQNWKTINFSTNIIQNGTLAEWNLTSINSSKYMIRLVSSYTDKVEIYNITVYIDKELHTGWPKHIRTPLRQTYGLVDLDNDGKLEIVVAQYYFPRMLYVFYENGSNFPNWPKSYGGSPNLQSSPNFEDFDNDSNLEIVHLTKDYMYIYLNNGSNLGGWPKSPIEEFNSLTKPAIGDLDNDGNLEVGVGGAYLDGRLYIYCSNGSIFPCNGTNYGWPKKISLKITSSPIFVDLNGDKNLEIIVSTYEKNVSIYYYNSSVLPGWPKNFESHSQIAASDLDYDGKTEIIVTTQKQIFVFYSNGSIFPGWPVRITDQSFPFTHMITKPVIGNIDYKDNEEIIVGCYNDTFEGIYVFYSNGSVFPGWPINLQARINSVSLADLDNDSKLEILGGGGEKFYIFNYNGSYFSGWPKYIIEASESPPAIADIDNDSLAEIVYNVIDIEDDTRNYLYVWDLNHTLSRKEEWPVYLSNTKNTNSYPKILMVFLLHPENNSANKTTNTIDFIFSVFDKIDIKNCSLLINDAVNKTISNVQVAKETNITVFLQNGVYSWAIKCINTYDQEKTSPKYNLSVLGDITPPNILILSPENKTYSTNISLLLNYTILENNFDKVWYSIDNGQNISLYGKNNFTYFNASEGSHRIRIYANDTYSNLNFTEITFFVDLPPKIELISPKGGTNIQKDTIFEYKVFDTFGVSNCSLYIDDQLIATEEEVQTGVTQSFVFSPGNGFHYWKIACRDTSNNNNISSTWNFTQNYQETTVNVGGGGGGGSSVSTTPTNETEETKEKEKKTGLIILEEINANEEKRIILKNTSLPISEINITTPVSTKNAGIILEEKNKTTLEPLLKHAYKYLELKVFNLTNYTLKIKLKVENKWIEENSINDSSVTLYILEKGWKPVSTKYLYKKGNYIYYIAELNSSGVMAIKGELLEKIKQKEPHLINETISFDREKEKTILNKFAIILFFVGAIIFSIIVILVIKKFKYK